MLFSDRVRFIPSVTVEPDQKIIIPSTPDHKVVSQAAEGKFIIFIINNFEMIIIIQERKWKVSLE